MTRWAFEGSLDDAEDMLYDIRELLYIIASAMQQTDHSGTVTRGLAQFREDRMVQKDG